MNTKSIIKADMEYIKAQLLELKKAISDDQTNIMVDDIIQHVEAFMEEDI